MNSDDRIVSSNLEVYDWLETYFLTKKFNERLISFHQLLADVEKAPVYVFDIRIDIGEIMNVLYELQSNGVITIEEPDEFDVTKTKIYLNNNISL